VTSDYIGPPPAHTTIIRIEDFFSLGVATCNIAPPPQETAIRNTNKQFREITLTEKFSQSEKFPQSLLASSFYPFTLCSSSVRGLGCWSNGNTYKEADQDGKHHAASLGPQYLALS
jgi:hypothetical protein